MQLTNLIPIKYQNKVKEIANEIKNIDKVIISGHVNPDSDSMGACISIALILKSLNKKYIIYSETGFPNYLSFLNMPDKEYNDLSTLPFIPDSAIFLDCNVKHRLGTRLEKYLVNLKSINIDHHLGNGGIGTITNWVEDKASATCELVTYLAIELGIKLEGDLANALLTGIIGDTGGFMHSNTTADILRLCAHFMDNGCNISYLRHNIENTWSKGHMLLWGELISSIELSNDNKIALLLVTKEILDKYSCTKDDLEGLGDMLRKLKSVLISAVLREDGINTCKFSLRSFGSIDVRKIAEKLGGGGHLNAAGGTLNCDIKCAKEKLLSVLSV